jgi:hypothetical protein
VWNVQVLDADPAARSAEVKVKVVAPVQPAAPEAVNGTPFRPVEFEGLSLTPYVREDGGGRARVAYSLRATGMRTPKQNPTPPPKPNS